MPEISTFYGITIRMFNKDHQPPHFHAEYGGKMESIDIRTGRVLAGNLPKRAHKMAMEWWEIHRDELLEMWEIEKDGFLDHWNGCLHGKQGFCPGLSESGAGETGVQWHGDGVWPGR